MLQTFGLGAKAEIDGDLFALVSEGQADHAA
jgi:hypothetical protein